MDKSKAKKAVKKSTKRKQQQPKEAMPMVMPGGMDPEIQVRQATMQPPDGLVNPYRALGTMAPTLYNPGNMLDGYNYPRMVNPET